MKKIFRILKNALCILICVLFAVVAVMTLFGAKGYSVSSDSMAPKLHRGDVVFVKDIPFEELEKGDVVTVRFKSREGTYTHRIASIDYDKKEIRTAGDNTNTIDMESAADSQIVGKVIFSIPLLGYLSLLLTNTGYVAAIALFVLLVMVVGFVAGKYYKNKARGDKSEYIEKEDN